MAMVDVAEQPTKRDAVSCEQLESEITEAVRKSEAGCKGFVGVLVERVEPKSHTDPNWAIKGVRFGRADRDKAGKVLLTVVDEMQREFALAENEAAIPQLRKQPAIDTNPPSALKKRRVRSGKPSKAIDKAPPVPKVDQNSAEVFSEGNRSGRA
jgi:hypothetical protein